jgi:hypothetical protein
VPAVAVIVVVPAELLVIVSGTEQVPLSVVHVVELKVPMTPETKVAENTTVVPSATGLLLASFTVTTIVSVVFTVWVLELPPSIVRVEFAELGRPGSNLTVAGLPGVPEIGVATPLTLTMTGTE